MIARITGTVVEREEKAIIVSASGIGYRVAVGKAVLEAVHEGEEVILRIYHHITQDKQDLYGFIESAEEKYFRLLLDVPSVGPRTARNILDAATPAILEQAVAEDDVTLLTKVSGVGKRTAERVLIELKARIKQPKKTRATGVVQEQAIEALISIGFAPSQARVVVGKLPKSVKTVEEAVKQALRQKA
ncbi:MAG: Holliday junction branch migration protein RuvA [Candidatus Andersenbacteria bacterium]|nr:Holliday junction branch migration protein RuvA [Candidatus Andersenbacteria bacterium]MBI3251170.1 Holliday junction branch migration protein RuvA [Candidatus Andersenbacteria bacterium]